jgi:hypothetical protein
MLLHAQTVEAISALASIARIRCVAMVDSYPKPVENAAPDAAIPLIRGGAVERGRRADVFDPTIRCASTMIL